jgi:hypothetical protein
MGSFFRHHFSFNINPPPAVDTQVAISISPDSLRLEGMNMPIEISTASIFRQGPNPMPFSSIVVMGHLDTGASRTSIDINLATHLHLAPMGQSTNITASGPSLMPDFSIDLSFPNTNLSPFANLKISSCTLGFDLTNSTSNPNDPKNFGILIGRDVMSRWNIVWNGPTSTVFISD